MATHPGKKKRKRRIMRSFKMNELSGVDKAAQVPANMLLMKRATPEEAAKRGMDQPLLTTSADGHTHLLDGGDGQGGETTWNLSAGGDTGHSHPWVRRVSGEIEIGEADGHTHQISQDEDINDATKSAGTSGGGLEHQGDEDMKTDEEIAAEKAEATEKRIQELETRAKRSESINKLDAPQRTHFDGLDTAGQDTFLGKSDTERAEVVSVAKANAEAADPIAYTAEDGTVYRKSADPQMVAMAKRMDTQDKELAKQREATATVTFEKRVSEELPNAPGTVAVRGGILKALEGVDGAPEFLKAVKAAMKGVTSTEGTKAGDSSLGKNDGGEDKLEGLAKAYAKEHDVSLVQARDLVLDTPDGAALYAETL